ncbi:hypothetical protein BC940DRAFT_350520 [Gongronella butleri]|nr:hypothetical protein BC940DRAFT_350520 [Gongronella butleri]
MDILPRKGDTSECLASPMCSPLPQETWVNGSTHQFVWNPTYIAYASNDTLNLYIYSKDTSLRLVKMWPNIEREAGAMSITVDDSWFSRPLTDQAQLAWPMLGYLLPPDWDPQRGINDPKHTYPGFAWTVEQHRSGTTGTTATSAGSSMSHNGSPNFPIWAIIVLTLCSVTLALVLALFGLWCYHKRRFPFTLSSIRGTSSQLPIPPLPTSGGGGLSHHPSQQPHDAYMGDPEMAHASTSKDDKAGGTSPTSQTTNNWHRRSSILTSSDAMLLGDTFRQALQTPPEWDEAEQEQRRRQLGNELLRHQLQIDEGSSIRFPGDRRLDRANLDTPANAAENASSSSI